MLVRKNTVVTITSGKLSELLPEVFLFIRTQVKAQLCIFNGRVQLDGEVVFDDQEVAKGQEITLLTPQALEPEVDMGYKVIYEDDSLLVIDKPAPLPVHTGGQYYFNTLLYHLKKTHPSLYPIHRLDRETSGVLILAKTKQAAQHFSKEFKKGTINKKYLAVTFNKPPKAQDTLTFPLAPGKLGDIRDHMLVDENGKACTTSYKLLASSQKFSLLELSLESGRRHQIRAHLGAIDCPIVGDKQYGVDPDLFVRFTQHKTTKEEILNSVLVLRQLLHCYWMQCVHPQTKELIEFRSLPRQDVLDFLNKAQIDFNFSSLE